MALNGEFVPQAERKLRGSISQRAVCTPVLIFLYQEICVQHPEQRRAVLCLGGEDEQPAVSSILQTSCCWRKKRFWWGRRPLSSKSRQWPSCLRHHRVLQKQKPGREAQAASGVCSSGTAFQEMALRTPGVPGCSLQQGSGRRRDGPRNHPNPPALWWAGMVPEITQVLQPSGGLASSSYRWVCSAPRAPPAPKPERLGLAVTWFGGAVRAGAGCLPLPFFPSALGAPFADLQTCIEELRRKRREQLAALRMCCTQSEGFFGDPR
ncbi:hypothetical protein Anapl_13029 [Anas platyrhynchos]|uniref:Uncharacterized protein n=1 Tax=Anas platyrhynchos TaxID=8839 RepID=R0JYW5_ANAPL|nr:hypothetical protein Anapl_13029 [Anas platyrhynchos]